MVVSRDDQCHVVVVQRIPVRLTLRIRPPTPPRKTIKTIVMDQHNRTSRIAHMGGQVVVQKCQRVSGVEQGNVRVSGVGIIGRHQIELHEVNVVPIPGIMWYLRIERWCACRPMVAHRSACPCPDFVANQISAQSVIVVSQTLKDVRKSETEFGIEPTLDVPLVLIGIVGSLRQVTGHHDAANIGVVCQHFV